MKFRKSHLYRRYPGGDYYLRIQVRGRRWLRSTHCDNLEMARHVATDMVRALKQEAFGLIEQMRGRTEVCTFGEVVTTYRKVVGGLKRDRTVEANVRALRTVVAGALGRELTMDAFCALRTSELTRLSARAFEKARMEAVAGKGVEAVESAKATVVSYFRQARSVFTEKLQQDYKDAGLVLPASLREWLEFKPDRPAVRMKLPPDDTLLARTFEASKELRRTDRDAYTAWLLGLSSLRRGEIQRAAWSWLVVRSGRQFIEVPVESKSKRPRLVPLAPQVASELENYRTLGLDKVFILPQPRARGGKETERVGSLLRRVDEWMRSLGWHTRHTLHELRAYCLQQVRDRHGLAAAQSVAGHADERTTAVHYAGLASVQGVDVELPMLVEPRPPGSVGDGK
jgi:integrase